MHACFTDDYHAYRDLLRGFRKDVLRELKAAERGNWPLAFEIGKKVLRYPHTVLDGINPSACELEVAKMVESTQTR